MTSDPFLTLIRDIDLRGWVRDYIEHGVHTETPASFRCLTGLVLVSAMLKRKIWHDQRMFTVRPPLQVMLVGPAGLAKKSTSAKYGYGLITDHLDLAMQPKLLQNAGSPEAIQSQLAEMYSKSTIKNPDGSIQQEGQACGLQVVEELSMYLNKSKYAENLISTLCALYDSPSNTLVRVTKTSKEEKIFNVGIAAVLCSNEDLLADSTPDTAIRGGFPSRVIFMHENAEPKRVAFPGDHMPGKEEEEKLAFGLLPLATKTGEDPFSPEAKEWHKKWYDGLDRDVDLDMQPFVNRIQQHQPKIGMLLAASSTKSNHVTLDKEHLQQAQAILDYAGKNLPHLYQVMARGTFGIQYEKVKRLLRQHGGSMPRAAIGRKLPHLSRTQLDEIVATLQANGVVEMSVNIGQWDRTVKLKGGGK